MKRSLVKMLARIANGIVMAVFFACVFAVFLFVLGTYVPGIPYFSARANYTTVGQMHIFLPLVVVIFLMCVIFFLGARKKGSEGRGISLILIIMSGTSLVMSLIIAAAVTQTVREHGSGASLLKSYALEDTTGVTMRTIAYSDHGGKPLNMDLYFCGKITEKRPVVMFIHGGGWIYGNRRNHTYYARRFARRGCLAVNVDYTLSTYKRHMAGSEKKMLDENGNVVISVVGTTAEKQIARAIGFLAENADTLGVDTEKMFLYGDSAGGNLACDVGFKINSGHYKTTKLKTAYMKSASEKETAAADNPKTVSVKLPRICAVSAEYPVADPVSFWQDADPYYIETARRMVYAYTGGTPWKKAAIYDSITPAEFVTEDAPPTLLIAGEGDKLVNPRATYDLAATLENLGVDSDLITIPFAGHAYDKIDGSLMSQAYFDLTLQWFTTHDLP